MSTKCYYFFRMECGSEDRESQVYGPFPEYLQLTHGTLTGLDGRILAEYDCGRWFGAPDLTGNADWITATPYTDIVIWAEPAP